MHERIPSTKVDLSLWTWWFQRRDVSFTQLALKFLRQRSIIATELCQTCLYSSMIFGRGCKCWSCNNCMDRWRSRKERIFIQRQEQIRNKQISMFNCYLPWMVNFKTYQQNKLATELVTIKFCEQQVHQESLDCKDVSLLRSHNFNFVVCCMCYMQTLKDRDEERQATQSDVSSVCKCRTAASDVDCCCLLRVLGSFLFSHCSWRHSLSNRTWKTLHIQRVNKPVRLKHAQSKSYNTLEQTVILTLANTTMGGEWFSNLRSHINVITQGRT